MRYVITEVDRDKICDAAQLLARIYTGNWNQERRDDVDKTRAACVELNSIVYGLTIEPTWSEPK